jgi:hypothetical protein
MSPLSLHKGHQIHLANTAAIQQDVIEGEISSSSAAFLGIALLCIDGVDFAAAEIGPMNRDEAGQ